MEFNLTPELIIGSALIMWGISILVKVFWGIDIPIFKPLLAIFFIYLGLSMLFGSKTSFFYKSYSYSSTRHEHERD